MLYLESMKIILKIPLKVCFVGEWEVISEEFMQKKATNWNYQTHGDILFNRVKPE